MSPKNFKEQLNAAIDKHWPTMVDLSDDLAAHPEVSGEEFRTSKKIAELLASAGFKVEYPFLGIPTAFIARAGERGNGAKVALMVEYDALPEIGHACGHNLHGAMSLLAGVALLPLMSEIEGELVVVGTPAEETNGAKVEMAGKGVFDDCDFAMMLHSSGGYSTVRYRSLAMDAIEFLFTGRAAHAAASPWEGRNALNGLQLFFHAVDLYRQHVKPDTRMHGIYSDGGTAPNIVPEHAAGRFYFRSPKREYLDKILEQIFNCARGAALATDTEVTWRNYETSFMDMLPNETAETMVEELFTEHGIAFRGADLPSGSSDVGDVSHRCPTLQPMFDIIGEDHNLHTVEFAKDTVTEKAHEALKTGAEILAAAALKVFTEPGLRERMRADYNKAKKIV